MHNFHRRIRTTSAAFPALLAFALSACSQNAPQLARTSPDPALTPGSVRAAGPADVCGHAREARRRMSRARSDEVMHRYGLPPGPHPDYEIDHLVPLCLGGADDSSNLWPEPRRSIEPVWNAERKDRLEARLCEMACTGAIALSDAQVVFTGDWIEGYRVYVEAAH